MRGESEGIGGAIFLFFFDVDRCENGSRGGRLHRGRRGSWRRFFCPARSSAVVHVHLRRRLVERVRESEGEEEERGLKDDVVVVVVVV